MEHLPGQTLADKLLKGPLPLAQALDFAAQIAEALGAAHKHGIVHRDLKPGNVMLTSSGAGRSGCDGGEAARLRPGEAGPPWRAAGARVRDARGDGGRSTHRARDDPRHAAVQGAGGPGRRRWSTCSRTRYAPECLANTETGDPNQAWPRPEARK